MIAPALPFVKAAHDKAARLADTVLTRLQDGRWHTAADLCADVQGMDDRTVRAIAERSEGAIISSAKGYRLTAHATLREVQHSANQLRSQARHMLARADKQLYVRSCCRG